MADKLMDQSDVRAQWETPVRTDATMLTRHRAPLFSLTGLRFFAASYVILFHTRLGSSLVEHGYQHAGRFMMNSYSAVTLFFMLSGFILAYNYRGQIESRQHAYRFCEARFSRIWPAYAFSLLCSSFPSQTIPSFRLALATLGMVQAWNPLHPEYGNAWNGVCWTLSVEGFFYLAFPAIQVLLDKFKNSQLVWTLVALMLAGVLFNTSGHNDSARYSGIWWMLPSPIIHLPEFVSGVLLGNLYLSSSSSQGVLPGRGADARSREARLFPASALTYVGLILTVVTLSTAQNRWISLSIPTFGALLYGLAAERSMLGGFLSTKLLILGGEISYAMYLLRTPLHGWIGAFPALRSNALVNLLYLPLGLVPLSLFSFYCVERPARQALRRFFATLQNRTT